MKLSEIKQAEALDLKSIADEILSKFKSHKLGSDVTSSDVQKPEKAGDGYEMGLRYWGEWEDPDEDEDDDDYDWRVPTRETTKIAKELASTLSKQYGVNVQLSGGEKDWTYITVSKA